MDMEDLYHEITIMRDQEVVVAESRYTQSEDKSEYARGQASAKRGRASIRAQAFTEVLELMEKEGLDIV